MGLRGPAKALEVTLLMRWVQEMQAQSAKQHTALEQKVDQLLMADWTSDYGSGSGYDLSRSTSDPSDNLADANMKALTRSIRRAHRRSSAGTAVFVEEASSSTSPILPAKVDGQPM